MVDIDASGIRKRIVTPSARLRASQIVLSGNVHLGAPARLLVGNAAAGLALCRRCTAPLGERLADATTFKGSITDTDGIDHFRIVEGDK